MGRDTEKQQAVLDLLAHFKGVEPLKKLFWTELNHERVNEALPMGGWAQPARDALAEPVLLLGS